jgi:hypothetical protein
VRNPEPNALDRPCLSMWQTRDRTDGTRGSSIAWIFETNGSAQWAVAQQNHK